jgi:hypothetical protein
VRHEHPLVGVRVPRLPLRAGRLRAGRVPEPWFLDDEDDEHLAGTPVTAVTVKFVEDWDQEQPSDEDSTDGPATADRATRS